MVSTFGMMWALNFTLNSVTMLALVLMVGIVIDDAIVVLENIFRFVEEKKMHPFEAAREATKEIGTAVLATTLSLVVIFVPVSFMSSVAGRFLYQFGITAGVAVLVSLLVSFTLTPLMSARLFNLRSINRSEHGGPKSRGGLYGWVEAHYLTVLAFCMRHRPTVLVFALIVMASSIPLYQALRQEFTPGNTDEGEFELGLTAKEGTSLTQMDGWRGWWKQLRAMPQITVVQGGIGSTDGRDEQCAVLCRLVPRKRVFRWSRLFAEAARRCSEAITPSARGSAVRAGCAICPACASPRGRHPARSAGGPNYEIHFSILGPDWSRLRTLRTSAPARDLGLADADTTSNSTSRNTSCKSTARVRRRWAYPSKTSPWHCASWWGGNASRVFAIPVWDDYTCSCDWPRQRRGHRATLCSAAGRRIGASFVVDIIE